MILIHWTARDIPIVEYHIRQLLGVEVITVRGHTENELAAALPTILADDDPNRPVMICPDDGIFTQAAIDAIHERYIQKPGVWCGWSNLDFTTPDTNVMIGRLPHPTPRSIDDYQLITIPDMISQREPFQVGFNGWSLFTMPASYYTDPRTRVRSCSTSGNGFASDWATCHALQERRIPIMCEPTAYAPHLKVEVSDYSTHSHKWKQLDLSTKTITRTAQ